MKIKTLEGYLTAVEKKAIKAILEAGLTEGRVSRKSYWIKEMGGFFEVVIGQNETNVFNRVEFKKYKHTFKMI